MLDIVFEDVSAGLVQQAEESVEPAGTAAVRTQDAQDTVATILKQFLEVDDLVLKAGVTVSALNHTIPQRLTVASVAYFKLSTSNIMRTLVESLKYATLATVSRCGMVWFNADTVTPTMMISNYVESKSSWLE
jgi:hypothetical protein